MTSITETKPNTERYLAKFEERQKEWAQDGNSWVLPLRQEAIKSFGEQGFPHRKMEEWRTTNVKAIAGTPFADAPEVDPQEVAKEIEPFAFRDKNCHVLVFINGRPAKSLWSVDDLPKGLTLMTMKEAIQSEGELVRANLGQHARMDENPFVALNTAFMDDGYFIHVERGVITEKPIHVLYYSVTEGEPTITHPRNLVVAEESSQVRVIESFAGRADEVYFTNAVTEMKGEANCHVDHNKLQRESEAAYHLHTIHIDQERDSHISNHAISLGSKLMRNDINVTMNDENIECMINGLYLGHNEQLLDTHTRMDHAKPHCHSIELYKGILDDKARGVFSGKILVREDAQKTDAIQSNHGLLLTDDALINTRPQLEIFADDVKCTHGATVGQLDKNALFYLRSRGIREEQARALLISAFANEIVDEIKIDWLSEYIHELVTERFIK
jgi:Fe-S cluster assembly protein SufD